MATSVPMVPPTLEERLARMEEKNSRMEERNSRLEERNLRMEERNSRMEERNSRMEERNSRMEAKLQTHSDLFVGLVGREIVILAAEILKWAVRRRGDTASDGNQLYGQEVRSLVYHACVAYGEYGSNPSYGDVEDFKSMGQEVIRLRNDTAHFENLTMLEDLVRTCKIAIREWPLLGVKFPHQVQIIKNYQRFKQLLPESFQ